MSDSNPTQVHATGETTGFIPAPGDTEEAHHPHYRGESESSSW